MTHDIRTAGPSDATDILAVVEASGLFEPAELDQMAVDVAAWADGGTDRLWLAAPGGAAMLAPEPMSGAAWNTLFIGVAPAMRREGLGRALVAAVETAARERGGRLMLIDTASAAEFAPARALYDAAGYAREAVIRDYYADGVDRVTYLKRL